MKAITAVVIATLNVNMRFRPLPQQYENVLALSLKGTRRGPHLAMQFLRKTSTGRTPASVSTRKPSPATSSPECSICLTTRSGSTSTFRPAATRARRALQHSFGQAAASPRSGLHRAVQPVGCGRKHEPRLGHRQDRDRRHLRQRPRKATKLIKQIGLELQQDPEFAPLIIEPLKMQGSTNSAITRLFGNAFYAADKRARSNSKAAYRPTLQVSTRDLGRRGRGPGAR